MQNEYLKPLVGNITLHEQGLWESTTALKFNPGCTVPGFGADPVLPNTAHVADSGMLSHVHGQSLGDSIAFTSPVTTIDEATGQTATFIKLEIEGSELKALHGARQTIARNRPQMAISMYHKPEDLLTLTEFVVETDKGYRLGFRQHNRLCPDAMVMYCA
ncbi:FkbM family methyltransferase [Pseudomonas sp. dw_358]|uniref:FkbM family methyltransferase n=1 Tax=Pseudomonas sp. dw_358 TaxID=2720083 RepID=UPI001BD41537|nr:FkbM family methyltransferase [Pseudomonas sp. dw_358]